MGSQVKPIIKIKVTYFLLLFLTRPLERLQVGTGTALGVDSTGPDGSPDDSVTWLVRVTWLRKRTSLFSENTH